MHHRHLASQWLDIEACLLNLPLDGFRVSMREIDFVDGHNNWDFKFLDEADYLSSLVLDSLHGRYHEDHQIGHDSPSLSHVGKGLVARRVDECNPLSFVFNSECSDSLCDSTVFFVSNIRFPQVVD